MTTPVKLFPGKRFPLHRETENTNAPLWLEFIWAVEEAAAAADEPSIFVVGGSPQVGPWWAGGYAEIYPEARVILDNCKAEGRRTNVTGYCNGCSARVVPLTERAAHLFEVAWASRAWKGAKLTTTSPADLPEAPTETNQGAR